MTTYLEYNWLFLKKQYSTGFFGMKIIIVKFQIKND